MIDIRTNKGKLFGMIDSKASVLHIKDGKNIRLIKIPTEGLILQYISNAEPPETIYVKGNS